MSLIVLISGKQGSGKDTLVYNLQNGPLKFTVSMAHIKFAQPIYEMHDAIRDIGDKYDISRTEPKDGRLLQLLGLEWGRDTKGQNVWVDAFKAHVKRLSKFVDVILCSDCRFRNEFDSFSGKNVLKVRLNAGKEARQGRCSQWRDTDEHASETDLDQYAQNGLFDLYLNTESMSAIECANRLTEKIMEILDVK